MDWVYYVALLAVLTTGFVLNLVGLPGLWVMVGGHAIFAWVTGGQCAGWPSLLIVLALALAAELAEFVAGAAGSKAAGGSFRSGIGAVVGGIVGAILFLPLPLPVLNAVLGACVGSFVGAVLFEATVAPQQFATARAAWNAYWFRLYHVGKGAAWGRLWGMLIKAFFGVIIFAVSAVTAFN